MKVVFHGSGNKFDSFSYENIGLNGTNEGYGFYFTDSKKVAKSYSNVNGKPGFVYTISFLGKKPFSSEKITISKKDLKRLLKIIDKDGLGFLSNYGDVGYDGYARILDWSVEALKSHSNSDVEIMGSLINAGACLPEKLFTTVYELLGYDSIIEKATWGTHPHTLYIATVSEAYEILSIEEQN